MICAECEHWTMGDTWGTNPNGRDHGVLVECKGWCVAKPNKRKRWNYQPCHKCNLFSKRERNGIIMSGCGMPTEEQMETLNYAYCELFKREDVGHNILGPLQNLIDILRKL